MAETMTTRTRLSVLLISTPLLAFIVFGGILGKASAGGDSTFQHLRIFEDVVSLILNNYVEDAKVDKVMEGAMRGLADGLDPDSAYLTAAEVKDLQASGPCVSLLPEACRGTAIGEVGIELTRQYYLRVIAARDGSAVIGSIFPRSRSGPGGSCRSLNERPARRCRVGR